MSGVVSSLYRTLLCSDKYRVSNCTRSKEGVDIDLSTRTGKYIIIVARFPLDGQIPYYW